MMQDKDTLYARWLAGTLTEKELEQLTNSEELADLEAIIEATDQLKLPKYDAEGAYTQFKKQHPNKKLKVRSLKNRWLLGIAAGVAVLLVAITFFRNQKQTINAALAETTTHQLPDQSTVLLNDGSSIVYKERNWDAERVLQLKGEASFKVETGNTFRVETKNGIIDVLGTQFNVRAWGNQLRVECYEGKVRVRRKAQEMILSRAESVVVIGEKMENKEAISHQQPLWIAGNARFYKENISEVFAELERQYNIKVQAPTRNRVFTGSFRHDDLERALNAICKPMQLKYTIEEGGQIVTIKE